MRVYYHDSNSFLSLSSLSQQKKKCFMSKVKRAKVINGPCAIQLCATIAKVIKVHISSFGTKAKCQTSKHSNSVFIIFYSNAVNSSTSSLSLPRTTTTRRTEEKLQGENLEKAVSKVSVYSLAALGFFNNTLGLYYYLVFRFLS